MSGKDLQRCLCSVRKNEHCELCQAQPTRPSGTKSLVNSFESLIVEKEGSNSGISHSNKSLSPQSKHARGKESSATVGSRKTPFRDFQFDQQQSIKILITGKSGNGKSVIINGLAGKCIIPERKGVVLEPRSEMLEYYPDSIGGVKLEVWSSSHLQDQDKRINRDEYLKSLKDQCSDVHIIIYCLNMNSTRFLPGNPEIQAMEDLTNIFGETCWKKTIFALTYANVAAVETFAPDDDEDDSREASKKAFENGISAWKDIIEDVLKNEVNVKLPLEIKPVPTGHYKKPSLPDRLCWLSSMFMECGIMMPEETQEALVQINTNRFKDSRYLKKTDVHGQKSYEQQISIAFDAVKMRYSSFVQRIKRKLH